jgi:type II secretion system (T2SS) protein M
MRRDRTHGTGLAVAAAMIGGAVAVVAATGLAALARPADRAERLAQVERKLDRLETLQRAAGEGPIYPRGAICREGVGRGVGLVEQKVRAQLGQARLATIAFEPSTPVGDSLMAVGFRFETEGSYEDAMTLLRGLDAARPTLFVDSVDLVSKTSTVSLRLSGRFYCSTSARL